MTVPMQQAPQQQHGQSIVGQVLTPADYALLGGKLGQAGYRQVDISALLATVERRAFAAAQAAAREVALAVVHEMATTIQNVHSNAAMEIHRQISDKTAGLGGLVGHRDCARIALSVANATPRHDPPPAPIIGSPR